MMDEMTWYYECHRCGKEFDTRQVLSECEECRNTCFCEGREVCDVCIPKKDISECPRDCGRNTVCKICAEYEGRQCQRCGQNFTQENSPSREERKSRFEGLRNWAVNQKESPSSESWHFRCLECGQYHLEYVQTVGFLYPVTKDGSPIECTRLPKIENGFCQDCGNRSEHAESCRFWKAKKELREAVTSE